MNIAAEFKTLSKAMWPIAARSFGNSHTTFVGVLTAWWAEKSTSHTLLDGAPGNCIGKGRKCADAIFCADDLPVGVLEVEGSYPCTKVDAIGGYFGTKCGELQSIRFGVLVVYAYGESSTGKTWQYKPATIQYPLLIPQIKVLTSQYPGREIFFVEIQKEREINLAPVRRLRGYYFGRINQILARRFSDGQQVGDEIRLFPKEEPSYQ
jgi:hypothetical protein